MAFFPPLFIKCCLNYSGIKLITKLRNALIANGNRYELHGKIWCQEKETPSLSLSEMLQPGSSTWQLNSFLAVVTCSNKTFKLFKPKLKYFIPSLQLHTFPTAADRMSCFRLCSPACPHLSFADSRSISSLILMNHFHVNQFNMPTVPWSSLVNFFVQQTWRCLNLAVV